MDSRINLKALTEEHKNLINALKQPPVYQQSEIDAQKEEAKRFENIIQQLEALNNKFIDAHEKLGAKPAPIAQWPVGTITPTAQVFFSPPKQEQKKDDRDEYGRKPYGYTGGAPFYGSNGDTNLC